MFLSVFVSRFYLSHRPGLIVYGRPLGEVSVRDMYTYIRVATNCSW